MAYFPVCLLNQRDCAVSYVRSVLQPNEKVLITGRLHWIVYIKAILFLIVGTALVALENNLPNGDARLKIPLISDEAINIGKSWLFEEELTELFHERPQAILPHGRDELIMQAALAEQRMDTSLGCAGL